MRKFLISVAVFAGIVSIVDVAAVFYFQRLAWSDDLTRLGSWTVSGGSPYHELAGLFFLQAMGLLAIFASHCWTKSKVALALRIMIGVILSGILALSIYIKTATLSNLSQFELYQALVTRIEWSFVLDGLTLIALLLSWILEFRNVSRVNLGS